MAPDCRLRMRGAEGPRPVDGRRHDSLGAGFVGAQSDQLLRGGLHAQADQDARGGAVGWLTRHQGGEQRSVGERGVADAGDGG